MQNTVKKHREEIGFSQERLGNVLGVSRGTVANWERGEQIKSSYLMQMVALFGCDINELLGLASETAVAQMVLLFIAAMAVTAFVAGYVNGKR